MRATVVVGVREVSRGDNLEVAKSGLSPGVDVSMESRGYSVRFGIFLGERLGRVAFRGR